MGTGTSHTDTQKTVSSKPPRCSICRKPIAEVTVCNWNQGRCPHTPSMIDQIMADPYRSRFYNLIKFFKGCK
jgi:hypothetical protein